MYSYEGLLRIVDNLVNFLIRMASIAVVVVTVWYGLQMALARGDAEKFAKAKKGLTWALVGAAVTFGLWTIIATVQYFVGSLGGQ